MNKSPIRLLGPLLVVVIFCVAVWLLHSQLTGKVIDRIGNHLHEMISTRRGILCIVTAVAITIVNYVILIGYDLLAVRYVGEKLPLRRIALASFVSYTIGYNLGSTLFGTSVRYRLYSAWGIPVVKILQLLVILALTFWFGLFALAGIVFLVKPLPMPAPINHYFPNTQPLGIILLVFAAIYLGMSALHRGSLRLWRWTIPVPPFMLTVYQILIASADLLLAAAVLYALWPGDIGIGYLTVLGTYMVVFVVGVLTHVPGGYGVMEITLVAIIPDSKHRAAIIASWLLFRVIYYIIPLIFGALLFAIYEIRLHLRDDGHPEPISADERLMEMPSENDQHNGPRNETPVDKVC